MDTPIAPLLVCTRPGRFQQRTVKFEAASSSNIAPATPAKGYQPEPIKKQQTTSVKKPRPSIILHSEEIVASAQEPEDMLLRNWSNIIKTIERVLNVILLSVLLFILVLIVLAELSAGANALILQLFHVDIQIEMAYLLKVIQQMHV